MTIEIVDFPNKNGGSFHSYVTVYQRVPFFSPLIQELQRHKEEADRQSAICQDAGSNFWVERTSVTKPFPTVFSIPSGELT